MFRVTLAVAVLSSVYAISQQTNIEDETPSLIVSLDNNSLFKLNLTNLNTTRMRAIETQLMHLDYDYEQELIFYTDAMHRWIRRPFYEVTAKEDVILSKDGDKPFGFCVDWVNDRLYFTDITLGRIEVSNYDGTGRTTLISSDIKQPIAIAVDPSCGWMFWYDRKIERARMDGSRRQVLVQTGLGGPGFLVLDYKDKRLYWIDYKLDVVESINYDGSDRKKVLIDSPLMSLVVFEDYIYYTLLDSTSVYRVDKRTAQTATTIWSSNGADASGLYALYDRRRRGYVCSAQSNPCLGSELCLASPDASEEGPAKEEGVLTNASQPATNATTDAAKIPDNKEPTPKKKETEHDENENQFLVSVNFWVPGKRNAEIHQNILNSIKNGASKH